MSATAAAESLVCMISGPDAVESGTIRDYAAVAVGGNGTYNYAFVIVNKATGLIEDGTVMEDQSSNAIKLQVRLYDGEYQIVVAVSSGEGASNVCTASHDVFAGSAL